MAEIKKGVKSFFMGESEEKPLAEMSFVFTGEHLIIIDRTYVSDELSGRGIGTGDTLSAVIAAELSKGNWLTGREKRIGRLFLCALMRKRRWRKTASIMIC